MRKGKMIAQGAHASINALLSGFVCFGHSWDSDDQWGSSQFSPVLPEPNELFLASGYDMREEATDALLVEYPELYNDFSWKEWMEVWHREGAAKIVVGCNSEQELVDLYRQADKSELPCALVEDHGRTEFHGVRTKTAVAIGPAPAEMIDPITSELKLL